ncbi:MAG: hypothetical protein AAFY41_11945, partial [Bacteroidota bacterium]
DYAELTDFQAGLPDNEIYTIHTDNSNGIWAAHQFGITHIAPLFPAYSFSHFIGLEGNLTSVSDYNNTLWVTTSLGLFYFDIDTTFENKVYYTVQKKNYKKTKAEKKEEPEAEKNKKPLIKRLFGKKKRAIEQEKKKGFFNAIVDFFEDDGSNIEKVKGKKDKNTKYIRRVRKIPVSVNYAFTKVEGANGKFISIVPYKDRLLAISTSGIYEVTEGKAEIIISDNVRAFIVNSKDQLVFSTMDLELKIYQLEEDIWIERSILPLNDIVVSMKEDDDQSIWMAGSSAIYHSSTTDSTLVINDKLSLNNIFLDDVNILNKNDTLYFINSLGYYYYDSTSNAVIENQKLKSEIGTPVHHLYDPVEKGVWVFNGKVWYHLKEKGAIDKLEYLGLFPDLRAISIDKKSKKLWLITQKNELLKYDPEKRGGLGTHNFFLKRVSNENGEIDLAKKLTLSYNENFLNIELSKPDFLGLLNPEFQYKLEGLHSDWSEWTRSKSIDFSFLPEGN